MSIKKEKIKNLIYTKTKLLLTSTAIKTTLLMAFVISVIVSFFPFFGDLFNSEPPMIYTNIEELKQLDDYFIEHGDFPNKKTDKYDLVIQQEDTFFEVEINSRKGLNHYSSVEKLLVMLNLEYNLKPIEKEKTMALINGTNIKILNEDEITKQISLESIMIPFSIIFFFMITLLVTRIGVQVASEKGNKITETILTSVDKRIFYFGQCISSMVVIFISFILVSIPMICAFLINNSKYTSDFSAVELSGIIIGLLHMIIISFLLSLIAIGIGSYVKHAEDSNVMSTMIVVPAFVSYAAYIINLDFYTGKFKFLNYIPVLSTFQIFGSALNGILKIQFAIPYLLYEVLLSIIVCFFIKKVFVRNI